MPAEPLRVRIEVLDEPEIAFGGGRGIEPRKGLPAGGPSAGVPGGVVNLGLVALDSEAAEAMQWIGGFNGFIAAHDSNAKRFPHWPGAEKALRTRFAIEPHLIRSVDEQKYNFLINPHNTPRG